MTGCTGTDISDTGAELRPYYFAEIENRLVVAGNKVITLRLYAWQIRAAMDLNAPSPSGLECFLIPGRCSEEYDILRTL